MADSPRARDGTVIGARFDSVVRGMVCPTRLTGPDSCSSITCGEDRRNSISRGSGTVVRSPVARFSGSVFLPRFPIVAYEGPSSAYNRPGLLIVDRKNDSVGETPLVTP